ncbi:hypothetical protein ABK040_005088 [Willaertia magna]
MISGGNDGMGVSSGGNDGIHYRKRVEEWMYRNIGHLGNIVVNNAVKTVLDLRMMGYLMDDSDLFPIVASASGDINLCIEFLHGGDNVKPNNNCYSPNQMMMNNHSNPTNNTQGSFSYNTNATTTPNNSTFIHNTVNNNSEDLEKEDCYLHFGDKVSISSGDRSKYFGAPDGILTIVPRCCESTDYFTIYDPNDYTSTKRVSNGSIIALCSTQEYLLCHKIDNNQIVLLPQSTFNNNLYNFVFVINSQSTNDSYIKADENIIITSYLKREDRIVITEGNDICLSSNNQTLLCLSKPEGFAIPLLLPNDTIYLENTGKYERFNAKREKLVVQQKALNIIRNIKGPVACVAVCGPSRTGKSYLLSKYIGSPTAFQLGHTFQAQTHGIWMWSKPIKVYVEPYGEINVILLDTEGTGAVSSDNKSDTDILLLSVLLSTLFIFNSKSNPTMNSLNELRFMTEISKNVLLKKGQRIDADFKLIAPKFIWLFRDVLLSIPKDYTLTEYLLYDVFGSVLMNMGNLSPEEERKWIARKGIVDFFESFEAIGIKPPTTKPKLIETIAYNEHELDPEFLQQINYFVKNIIPTNLKPKQNLKGGYLTGSQFAELILVYLDSINTPGMVPVIEDSYNMVIQNSFNRIIENCIFKYNNEMSMMCPLNNNVYDSDYLLNCHDKVMNVLMDYFDNETQFEKDSDTLCHYGCLMVAKIDERRQYLESVNKENSTNYCFSIKQNVVRKIMKIVQSITHQDTIANLESKIGSLMLKYEQQAIGPSKEDVYLNLLEDIESIKQEAKHQLTKLKDYQQNINKLNMENEKKEAFNKRLQKEKEETAKRNLQLKKDMLNQKERMEKTLKNQEIKMKNERNKLFRDFQQKENRIKQENSRNIQNLQNQFNQTQQQLQNTIASNNSTINQLSSQVHNLQHQLSNMPRGGGGGRRGCILM